MLATVLGGLKNEVCVVGSTVGLGLGSLIGT